MLGVVNGDVEVGARHVVAGTNAAQRAVHLLVGVGDVVRVHQKRLLIPPQHKERLCSVLVNGAPAQNGLGDVVDGRDEVQAAKSCAQLELLRRRGKGQEEQEDEAHG